VQDVVVGFQEVGEKGPNFRHAHLGRMAHVTKVDVAFDPVDVGLLGADGVVPEADGIANLVVVQK
jgi:hypothetical protein